MKHLWVCLFALATLAACNTATTSSDDTKDTTTATTTSSQNVTYAYTPSYSADFEIGDAKYAQTVLELWKDYDDNDFERHKDAFADSVTFDLSGGDQVRGTRDSVVASMKAYRSSFKNVVSSIDVVTTLKPKGKEETWVCVWGKEVDTHNDNKVDSISLQENWMFDKDGKIAYMLQFAAKPVVTK